MSKNQRTSLPVTALAQAFLIIPSMSLAVGINGFVPTDTNVLIPETEQPTTVWKQVGSCSASAVQISPRWVLSTSHAPCRAGMVFRRSDGAAEVADFEPPTLQGQVPLLNSDLKLTRLSKPLPYGANFVPLVFGVNGLNASGPTNKKLACKKIDLLTAGNGYVSELRRGRFQVAWSPIWTGEINLRPTDPTEAPAPIPRPTSGDSGGGIFMFQPDAQPMLFSIISNGISGHRAGPGFSADVKNQINAVLADPVMNPGGEQVNWLDGSRLIADAPNFFRVPPLFSNTGGRYDAMLIPEYGLVTQTTLQQFSVRIPLSENCGEGTAPEIPYGYRVKAVQTNVPAGTYVPVRQVDVVASQKGSAYATVVFPGLYPLNSDWKVTVSTLDRDAQTGIKYESSLSVAVVDVHVKEREPQKVAGESHRFVYSDNGGSGPLQSALEFSVAADARFATPEGILVRVAGRMEWVPFDPDTRTAGPILVGDWETSFAQGSVLNVTVWPYQGARLGVGSVFEFVVPGTISCNADTGEGC